MRLTKSDGQLTKFFLLPLAMMLCLGGSSSIVHSQEPEIKKNQVIIYSVQLGKNITVNKVQKTAEEWRQQLTPEQYYVARQKGTERAYSGEYHDYKKKGIYQCVACGTDLYSSEAKYDSKSGWPSFTAPVSELNIKTMPDNSLFRRRTELLCVRCDSHLGHVFDDGPAPTFKRHCINSAALSFTVIPVGR